MRPLRTSALVMVFGFCLVDATAQGQERNDEQARAIAAFGKFRVGLIVDELQAGRPVIEADLREMDITDADLRQGEKIN
jgi:hypothetical protein